MLDEVADRVHPSDFFQADRSEIFAAMLDMASRGNPVDTVTLADFLTLKGRFDIVGGDDTLTALCASVPHGANAIYYADIVRERSVARQVIEASTENLRDCYSNQYTASELVCSAEERVFAIAESEIGRRIAPMDVRVDEAMCRMEMRKQGHFLGIPTGFTDLDEYLYGLQPGQIVILAARPSQGKTALALDICRANASQGNRSLFFSLEMSALALTERLIANVSGISGKVIKRPKSQTPAQSQAIAKAAVMVQDLPIVIDDTAKRNITQMSAIARREKRRDGLALVVIDYLSLIDAIDSQKRKIDNREQEVARISRGLKIMSKEVGVPVLALQQLNRQSENRSDHRPKLWDLRESGQIEQDADIVLLLHRPERYDRNDRPGEADVDIAKNRDGDTGIVTLAFRDSCTRFDNFARNVPPPRDDDTPF